MKKRPTPTKEAERPHSVQSNNYTSRQRRILSLLLDGPASRETIDRYAGCSNGPALVAKLRRRGYEIPCRFESVIDRDGKIVKRGIYFFTDRDIWLTRNVAFGQGRR